MMGPLWGAAIGLMLLLTVRTHLLGSELEQIKRQHQEALNDLPDLVETMVRQRLHDAPEASAKTPPNA
ncbi:MAG: hypothetical protein ACOZAQ_02295 [Pseudomonadota bacterium]